MTESRKLSKHRYIVDENGKRVSVVLPVEEYEELMEDVADLAAIAERRNEETIDHAELVRQLKADGYFK
jgi:PHD/YefM family antitoxin component YafN of YafNO toxin-antitoxin module